jgi:hypothetical protein
MYAQNDHDGAGWVYLEADSIACIQAKDSCQRRASRLNQAGAALAVISTKNFSNYLARN